MCVRVWGNRKINVIQPQCLEYHITSKNEIQICVKHFCLCTLCSTDIIIQGTVKYFYLTHIFVMQLRFVQQINLLQKNRVHSKINHISTLYKLHKKHCQILCNFPIWLYLITYATMSTSKGDTYILGITLRVHLPNVGWQIHIATHQPNKSYTAQCTLIIK